MLLEVFLLKTDIVKKLHIVIIVIFIIIKRNRWQLHIGLPLFYLCNVFTISSTHCTMVHPWWRLQWEWLLVEWGIPQCVSLVGIKETSHFPISPFRLPSWECMHLWCSLEIWQTSLTHQPKVVVSGVQVVYDSALILPLLSIPWAEPEDGLTLESLRGVYAPETHYFGRFERWHYPEIVEVFGRPLNHIVGRVEFLPALPLVFNWVDFGAQETCHLCHLSKDISQFIIGFLIEGQQIDSKIGLPYALN